MLIKQVTPVLSRGRAVEVRGLRTPAVNVGGKRCSLWIASEGDLLSVRGKDVPSLTRRPDGQTHSQRLQIFALHISLCTLSARIQKSLMAGKVRDKKDMLRGRVEPAHAEYLATSPMLTSVPSGHSNF